MVELSVKTSPVIDLDRDGQQAVDAYLDYLLWVKQEIKNADWYNKNELDSVRKWVAASFGVPDHLLSHIK